LLATLIDDRFTFIGPDAQVEDRKAYLAGYEGMQQAGIEVEGIDLSELEFRILGEVGIVTGRVQARVKMQGTPLVENVRFTRVYRRTDDGWRMMAGQGTRIPEAQPAKG
jgi:ketosteroid isomerase-like protein